MSYDLASLMPSPSQHLTFSVSTSRGQDAVAIEVKSGRSKAGLPGTEAFSKEFKVKRNLLIGKQGISLERFFLTPPADWFN